MKKQRCPACGAPQPPTLEEVMNEARRVAQREAKTIRYPRTIGELTLGTVFSNDNDTTPAREASHAR